MYDTLLKIFDYIFPPSTESNVVLSLTREKILSLFSIRNIHDVIVLSSFSDSRMRALIHEAKFHGNPKAFTLLNMLYTRYLEQQTQHVDTVIPIPLSSSRLRKRGFNQVAKILGVAAKNYPHIHIDTDVLVRARDTVPQTELPRTRRLENVRDAFKVTDPGRITGRHILLIDDVMTTGATLHAAKASLLPHSPASVTALAIAH